MILVGYYVGVIKTVKLLSVDELDDDHIDAIRSLAQELHETEKFDSDIFKATIQAVFDWIGLCVGDDTRH